MKARKPSFYDTYRALVFGVLVAIVLIPSYVVGDAYCSIPCGSHRYCCGYERCCIVSSSPSHQHIWGIWYFWFTLGLLVVFSMLCCCYLRKRRMQREQSQGVIVYSAQSNAVKYLPNESSTTYATTSTTHYLVPPPVYQETVTSLHPGYPQQVYSYSPSYSRY